MKCEAVPPLVAAVPQAQATGQGAVVALTLAGTFGWLLLWYWSTALGIAGIWWRSETFAHGLAVLPICAWLVWRRRDRLQPPQPTAWAVLPVALAGFAWLLGRMASVNALEHVAFVTMLAAALAGMLGWRLSRVLAFPLLFLFFGAPVGEFLMPMLMAHTATFTVGALRLSGVPVYQEGLHFIVPNGRWSVVEACSGIRYLIASLMVGTLYAYLYYRNLHRRLLFVAVATVVPIVANWVRAYGIVMLGYLTDNRVAAGVDHLVYGWLFFGVVVLLMFAIGARWREDGGPEPVRVGADGPVAAQAGRWWPVAVLAIATAFWPPLLARFDAPVVAFEVPLALRGEVPGWTPDDAADPGFRPHFQGARGEFRRTWRRGDEVVTMQVHYYAAQTPGHELVMWSNRLVGGEPPGWILLDARQDELSVAADGGPAAVRHAAVGSLDGLHQLAVWSWYWMDERVVISDVLAKALKAVDRLAGRADDAAHVALLVPQDYDEARARAAAADFARAAGPALRAMLREAAKVSR
jgi:exosortase A